MPGSRRREWRRSTGMNTGIDIRVEADTAAALQAAADVLLETARSAAAGGGCISIAISGGSTPRGMHRLWARNPYASDIAWDRMHLFWADERLVPYAHPDSNFGTARTDFIEKLATPPAGVHPVPVAGDPEALARRYEEELRAHFRMRRLAEPVFDLIILGVGADGHTASLFPGSPAIEERLRWTAAVKGGQPEVWRVTLTYAVLNRARRVVFLACGASKAAVVRRVLTALPPDLPAQRVRLPAGRVTWVLDPAAAALLESASGASASDEKPPY
jgi:6-phosphogluconolactonase